MIHTNTNTNIELTTLIALQDSQISDLLKLDELAKKKQELEKELSYASFRKVPSNWNLTYYQIHLIIIGIPKKQALKHEIRNGLGGLKCDLDLLDEQKATVKEYNRLLNSLKEKQAIVKQELENFRDARG